MATSISESERREAPQGLLFEDIDAPGLNTLAVYERRGGYESLKRALDMNPEDVLAELLASGVRGRGGAGFSMGKKASFLPKGTMDKYLVCNADESEPGTFKDRELMQKTPHLLIEGMVIAAYATGVNRSFIYIRGEYAYQADILEAALVEAKTAGYVGERIMGSRYGLSMWVHRGAGAYICGEETAMLDSLEGLRGQPRLRPPFPAVAGLYASPTVINNVESIASVPSILRNGAQWFTAMGTSNDDPKMRSKGMTLYSLSGHVTRPGQYEAPMGVTLRELLDLTGGMREGHELKFWTPGGSSTPLLTAEHLDVPLSYEGIASAGSMLGTKALQVFDETTCVVRCVLRWTEFYAHESCGKCTPCREGTFWLVQILRRLETGLGTPEDLEKLLDISDNILGRSFCALGDGATSPITSSLEFFRDEYVAHLERGGCPFDPAASTVFADTATAGVRAR